MMRVTDCNTAELCPSTPDSSGNSCNLKWKEISSLLEQHLIALMVWDKNNAVLIVIKQKVFISNREKEWAGEDVTLYPDLPRRKTEWDLSTKSVEWSTEKCFRKKNMWDICGFWPKCVLQCTSERSPLFLTSQLFPTVTNHWALNTTFAHCFSTFSRQFRGLSLLGWWLLQEQRLLACSCYGPSSYSYSGH